MKNGTHGGVWIAAWTCGLLATLPFAAHASPLLSITPDTDPGNVTVGSNLSFTVSTSPIVPPVGENWAELDLGLFRATGGSGFNFNGTCSNDSGLSSVSFSCGAGTNAAFWQWESPPTNRAVSGDLFTFSVSFDQVGTYDIYLERAFAIFVDSNNTIDSVEIPFSFTSDDPISINVAPAASVPEPMTCALFGFGLAGLASARRRRKTDAPR